MRGIVELEVLSAIEKELPAGIPIKQFFDLIVGTRYVYEVLTVGHTLRKLPPNPTLRILNVFLISQTHPFFVSKDTDDDVTVREESSP